MAVPKILQVLNKSVIAGVIVSALSFVFPIVPCTKSAVIAEPVYKLGACSLPNPFSESLVGVSTRFYGLNTEPLTGLVLQFLIITLLLTLLFTLFGKKNKKFLDLTKK